MIDITTATLPELGNEIDRVVRAISIPGCTIEQGYLQKLREAYGRKASKPVVTQTLIQRNGEAVALMPLGATPEQTRAEVIKRIRADRFDGSWTTSGIPVLELD